MNWQHGLKQQVKVHRQFAVQFLGILVSVNGLYILATTLLAQIGAHRSSRINDVVVDLPLLIGLSLLYLGGLLRRRKRTAWLVTVISYAFYLGIGVSQLFTRLHFTDMVWQEIVRAFVVPLVVLALLLIFQSEFVVKSDIQGFGFAARFSLIILMAAFIYGVSGFLLLDESDFHQEIGVTSAVHYTIDQFNLTTEPLHPYTKRAHLFVDSLSFVSVGAVAYALFSLFQPLRSRFSDHAMDRARMVELLNKYGGHSEDFFKLWPQDKQYFFDSHGQSALAFHVSRGVALCLSDPIGNEKRFSSLLKDFNNQCFGNDWLPALIHAEGGNRNLYERHGFSLQKLGQEAVVDINKFNAETVKNKYFRQIGNKFGKHGYKSELLKPPHHEAVIARLKAISDEWLSQGARAERGFAMGYFTTDYIQQCEVMVARDAADTIQAFVNLVPASFDHEEATYDMLRNSSDSLGNINDFILIGLLNYLGQQGYSRLNLGLCPLVGLENEPDQERNKLIDSFLTFAYANGDRFYSFQGLHRFKAKYEPEWRDRYVVYQGGLRGFTRTMGALMRAMRV